MTTAPIPPLTPKQQNLKYAADRLVDAIELMDKDEQLRPFIPMIQLLELRIIERLRFLCQPK